MINRVETTHSVRLQHEQCTFTLERLQPGVVLVKICGYDSGLFGSSPVDELTEEMNRKAPLELFVDAREARGAAWEVSRQWADWFKAHKGRLTRVHILARSKYVHLTVSVAKELSRTGDMIAIYSTPERFEEAVRRRAPSWSGTSDGVAA